MMRGRVRRGESDVANFDLSVSDLMAALVLIFILILSIQFLEVKKQSAIASQYREKQRALILALKSEFKDDLAEWSAEIDEKNLLIRFREEDQTGEKIGFDGNSSVLKERFRAILDDFFPRYIAILIRSEFIDSIEEIRIEGHTANANEKSSNPEGYATSIKLSQERANNVLFYVMRGLDSPDGNPRAVDWVRKHIAASGYAFARPITLNGEINWNQSRRVEFRIRTNDEELIQKIIDVSGGGASESP